jgi:hypothetical protein
MENAEKLLALRNYLNANRKFLNLSAISLAITTTNKMLLTNFLDSKYKGNPMKLGDFQNQTFEYFEKDLKIKFYEKNI